MKNNKIVWLMLMLFLPLFNQAQTITIAHIGPSDKYIMPIMFTLNSNSQVEKDSLSLFVKRQATVKVSINTFKWLDEYLKDTGSNPNSEKLVEMESYNGSCAIYKTLEIGQERDYYFLSNQRESVEYLEALYNKLHLAKKAIISDNEKKTILLKLQIFICELKKIR